MIRLNKKSNWKKKCKSSKSAWKTWERSIGLMRRNFISTTKYFMIERLLISLLWIPLKPKKEESRALSQQSKPSLRRRVRDMKKIIKQWPKIINDSQRNTSFCRRNMNDSNRVIKIDSQRFGPWIRTKWWLSARKLRTVTELFMFSNLAFHGLLLQTQFSNKVRVLPMQLAAIAWWEGRTQV